MSLESKSAPLLWHQLWHKWDPTSIRTNKGISVSFASVFGLFPVYLVKPHGLANLHSSGYEPQWLQMILTMCQNVAERSNIHSWWFQKISRGKTKTTPPPGRVNIWLIARRITQLDWLADSLMPPPKTFRGVFAPLRYLVRGDTRILVCFKNALTLQEKADRTTIAVYFVRTCSKLTSNSKLNH